MKWTLLLLMFLGTACIARANGSLEGETKKTDIAGGVIHADTKKPLSNVSVTVYSSSKKEKVVYTDNNGNYSFDELKPGTYKIIFEKDGFKKVVREKITIKADEGYQLNIEMNEEQAFQIIPAPLLWGDI